MSETRRTLLITTGNVKTGPRAGYCICAMIAALLCFPATASLAEGAAAGEAETQRLTAEGESELLGIVAAGRLETLNWPQFGDYQAEVGEYYQTGGYTLTWVRKSRPTAKARVVIKRLQAADNEGLLAQDYDSPLWAARLAELELPGRPASESQLLRFDLALTICAMRYILDLHLGRINPQPFHAALDVEPDIRRPSDFLRKRIVSAEDVAAAFSAVEPPFPSYRRLVKAVQLYKQLASRDDGGQLPASKTPVKPGARYSGVPRLTSLLKLLGDLPTQAALQPGLYAGPLVKAVKRFQRRHGLAPDGILGEQTLRHLNTPLAQRLRQLQLTLERWRWLPHRFSRSPILVNIPEFRLYAGDSPSQKVVVGMAFEHETPVFASELTEIVFRPPWTVPMSIQRSELVPKIEKNPSYLEANDFEVIDGKEAVVSSGAVSTEVLNQLREGQLYLRQRPGPANSLGLVKFLMPNAHSVYLHGTPSRRGFRESERDLSHGCIRVEDPGALAAWALRYQPEWTPERIRAAMAGAETVTVKLTEPIPVLLQYGTAVAVEGGEVHFFDDIYGRDGAEGEAFEKRARIAAR
ncbi:MAG: L,D-transpeptidase family protein [Elusimicrobiota bacterium]|nr:L,D-transpeptidase family protein [Elusimicrobiota bacterium]